MNTGDTLNKAADLIQERGWGRGPSAWGDGSTLCLEGALLAAMGLEFQTARMSEFWACPAYRAVMQHLGRYEGEVTVHPSCAPILANPLYSWNDQQESAEQVIEALRAAAVIEAARETADVRESVPA